MRVEGIMGRMMMMMQEKQQVDRKSKYEQGMENKDADFLARIDAVLEGSIQGVEQVASEGDGVEEIDLLDLIWYHCLDSNAQSGRSPHLIQKEPDNLITTVKMNCTTQRMCLEDHRSNPGLTHISNTTVYNAPHAAGIKAYQEEFKFILTTEGLQTRILYSQARQE
ncbi:hypothetical protein BDD12DRAFT_882475 [Trichophaea hybrida]|nr:hypothetical protein BDD12DRAFT_882475 [Trichophaea hybrida]